MDTKEIDKLLEVCEAAGDFTWFSDILSIEIPVETTDINVRYPLSASVLATNEVEKYITTVAPSTVHSILTELKSALERERELQLSFCEYIADNIEIAGDKRPTVQDIAKANGWTCFEPSGNPGQPDKYQGIKKNYIKPQMMSIANLINPNTTRMSNTEKKQTV